ncbi:MAG: 23S rRNA (guanosine(2251)-2'-O)-methyltransferase RlmB [Candidatus Hydrogenedentes bacterium]|nr:23S rRNA (guanosine(2251)-2'-O)-methyltransferase RlmB [Candidatus Hydrogenedentota bacterium]
MSPHYSEIIAGRLPVLSCLKAKRRRPDCLYVYGRSKEINEIVACAKNVTVQYTDRKHLDTLSFGVKNQGVVLRAAPLPVFTVEDWVHRHKNEKNQALVVLDGIEDPQNFGAIVRSAAACGASGVLFSKDRSSPITTAAMKAAAGGMEHVDLIQATNLVRALAHIKEQGFWITALDADAKMKLWEVGLTGRVALIIGSEGAGIRRLVCEHADFTVSIPLVGAVSSLNASVSAGIVLAEWIRQTRGSEWKSAKHL